jgi:arylsulfatase A-like enzyme
MNRIRPRRLVRAVWLAAAAAVVLAGCGRPSTQSGSTAGLGSGSRPGIVGATVGVGQASRTVKASEGSAAVKNLRKRAASANVVICVIDAARADHVGCYGYPRDTTPNIDRLAGESIIFQQHFSPYPHTKPSTASLFTGQYPDTHLVERRRAMEANGFSMANALESAGLQSVFLSSSPQASPAMGIGKDFQFVCGREMTVGPGGGMQRGGRAHTWQGAGDWKTPQGLLDAFSGWLDAQRTGRFFAYVHLLPPHVPYRAPEKMQKLFAGKKPPNAWQGRYEFGEARQEDVRKPLPLDEWVNSYDANMRWADWAVGEVEKALRDRNLLENTVFVVTSDHGEAFGEHGYRYHIHGVYDELVHVPLLIRFPRAEAVTGSVSALTQTVDVLPTILDLFGVPCPPDSVQGHSLLPLISGEAQDLRDYVYARCEQKTASYLERDRSWALILWEGGKLRALYDLRADPRQARNVIRDRPEQAARMLDAFRRFAATQKAQPMDFIDPNAKPARLPAGPEVTLTDKQRRELEALGYVD